MGTTLELAAPKVDWFILLSILIPIVGALLIWVSAYISKTLRQAMTFLVLLVPIFLVGRLLPDVFRGMKVYCLIPGFDSVMSDSTLLVKLPSFFNVHLVADTVSVVLGLTFAVVAFLTGLYSFSYLEGKKNLAEYYAMIALALGSVLGVVFSANLLWIYLFWEIAAICTWRLVGFWRGEEHVKAANKAFIITFTGASFMLIGFLMMYATYDTLDLYELARKVTAGDALNNIMLMLVFLGVISKSATVPLHTWVPSAYRCAPHPAAAFLAGAVEKIGIYVFLRVFVIAFGISPVWALVVPVIAMLSAFIAASSAMAAADLKTLLAYSTISQLGYVFLGLSINLELGVMGAVLYIVAHSLAKSGLFLAAGIIEHQTGEGTIAKLGGLMKNFPVTGVSFLLCGISIAGLPPLIGFFGKLYIVMGAIKAGYFWIAGIAVVVAVMTLMYMLKAFTGTFLGDKNRFARAYEGSPLMVSVVCLLALLSILSSGLAFAPALVTL